VHPAPGIAVHPRPRPRSWRRQPGAGSQRRRLAPSPKGVGGLGASPRGRVRRGAGPMLAGVAFLVQVLIVEVFRGDGLFTRRMIENGVPDIPDGLVHLVGGVADLVVRGVIAH